MIDLATDVRSEISALQWLPIEAIKTQYTEFIPDFGQCNSIDTLRAVIIYRMQEKFYGLRLSDEELKQLDKAVEGDRLIDSPTDGLRASRKKIRCSA